MSKIIIITNRLVVGGPSVHLKQLVDFFIEKHQLFLLYGPPLKGELSVENEFRNTGVRMQLIDSIRRSGNLLYDRKLAIELEDIFLEFKPDIVHTHTFKPGISGRYIAHKCKVPKIIHTYHGLIFENYFSFLISKTIVTIDRYLAKKTDVIICLSNKQKAEITDKYKIAKSDKVKVIPLATSFKARDFSQKLGYDFRHKWKIDKDTIIIIQIGRLADVKHISLMLDIFYEIKKKTEKKIVLFEVGDGDLKETLIDQAQSLHLKVANGKARENADVVFTSWCKDLEALYSAVDLLVLTSKSEGTPLNIIEAQISGVPVLAPRIGGIEDMVIEGETAILYSKASEIESKLLSLLDLELLEEMGNNAAIFAGEKYNLDLMLKEYDKIYK